MAKIVLGLGTTHGPLLATPPEAWDGRARVDRANPELVYRDGTYDFKQLHDLRKDPFFEKENSLAVRTERYNRCQAGMDRLGEVFAEVKPDVIVIVGDDQREWFQEEVQPSFAVYCGASAAHVQRKMDVSLRSLQGSRRSASALQPQTPWATAAARRARSR